VNSKSSTLAAVEQHGSGGASPTPRGITRQQAADYCCGGNLSTFDVWVRRGIVPGPIPGTKRWDRKAIDAALDKVSELIPICGTPQSPQAEADAALQEWLADAG
jgi:hypothetical protein